MKLKIIATLAACGAVMMYSGIKHKSNYTIPELSAFTQKEIVSGKHIFNATQYLNDKEHIGLAYMKFALNEDVPTNYDSNDIIKTVEQVIDKYSKLPNYRYTLLELAKEADKYERKETTQNILQEKLENIDWGDASDSFKYHLWMMYRIESKRTDSIKDLHKNLEDFYIKNDRGHYIPAIRVFTHIEKNLPEKNSRLVDMVMQKSTL